MKKLGFGFMRLPVRDASDRSTVDLEQTCQMVDRFLERGFTYFDTAHRYHDEASEPAIRECLVRRHPRESFVLTNKITFNYIQREEDQWPFFRQQLEICGVDYFDNYLIHNLGTAFYPAAEKFHTFDFLKSLKAQGLTRRIGFSFHGTADLLDRILTEHPETELVQLQLNYLDWTDFNIQSEACYQVARKHGKEIVVMEPVKGGTLVNLPDDAAQLLTDAAPQASLASWAIRFAASHEGILTVLSGMSDLAQLEDNTGYMADFQPLTQAELDTLHQVAERIRANSEIPCTNCRYCVTDCPKHIAIPDYFGLYNNYKRLKNTGYMYNQKVYYANLARSNGKASDCIACGLCEKNCPQRIPIREKLRDVAAVME